jgi:hypothetical protein
VLAIIAVFAPIIGIFTGVLGYVLAEMSRWFMLSQWRLHRTEQYINQERERLANSPVERFLETALAWLIGLVIVGFWLLKKFGQ